MKREHGLKCRCWRCRHARFKPGFPTAGKASAFYGNFPRRTRAKRRRIGAMAEAINRGAKPDPGLGKRMRMLVASAITRLRA